MRHGGGGVLTVEVIASLDAEQALWRFTAKGFADAVSLSYAVAPTRRMKMSRDGDLGLEPRESYDADPHAMPVTGRCSPDDCLLLVNGEDSLRVLGGKRGQTAFEKELNAIGKRMSRLEFSTLIHTSIPLVATWWPPPMACGMERHGCMFASDGACLYQAGVRLCG